MPRFWRYLHPRYNFAARFIYAIVLVVGTYNPTGWSLGQLLWDSRGSLTDVWPLWLLGAGILGYVWVLFVRAGYRALGLPLVLLVAGIIGLLMYMSFHLGWLALSRGAALWAGLVGLSLLLGYGASHASLWFQLFGQRQVDVVHQSDVQDSDVDRHQPPGP